MPLSLKQAHRQLAKSRRRVWRLARRVLDPVTVANWSAQLTDYTPTQRAAVFILDWLPRYAPPHYRGAVTSLRHQWERRFDALTLTEMYGPAEAARVRARRDEWLL